MAKRAWITTAVLVVVAGLVAAGYHVMANREETFCGFCHRSIHPNTKVVAEIDGRRRTVCCARCAISEAYQEKKPLRLIAVTDYVSSKSLSPERAYFVDGSRKVLCAHDEAMVDESKHAGQMTFDRCFPGTYAFAQREDAEAFARENGGTVLQLQQLMQGVSAQ
ncbi:MAG TPA: nitrous oxide reductase accessory protein NosL [Candidatus Binatia bacterium]|nr:nitrous oxide reductase accessory protein NosL [Candidatus Binatia bacterium]